MFASLARSDRRFDGATDQLEAEPNNRAGPVRRVVDDEQAVMVLTLDIHRPRVACCAMEV